MSTKIALFWEWVIPILGMLLGPACVARAPSPACSRPQDRPLSSLVTDSVMNKRKSWQSLLRFLSMPDTSTILAKYKYRRRLPYLQKADAALFVTFCTGARMVLWADARELVFEHGMREAGLRPFADEGARATLRPRIQLHALVVMPDHAHLLFTPLRDKDGWPFPLVDVLQCFKSVTAHRINRLLHLSGPVWEEESFDHVLRSDESLKGKCEYIWQNPVRAGLVKDPKHYPWLWSDPMAKL